MKRYDFSPMVGQLLTWLSTRYYVLLGHAERSTEEQKRMFDAKLSKCDGVHDISAHQYRDAGGRYAVDIFLHTGDGNIDWPEPYMEAHVFWISIGGSPPTTIGHWTDWPHFEAR